MSNIKYVIFLDDERNIDDVTWVTYPDEEFVLLTVRTYAEFIDVVLGMFNAANSASFLFSLDHDLQDFDLNGIEYTGYTCIQFLMDYCISYDIDVNKLNIVVHSKNPIGTKNIQSYIQNVKNFVQGIRY